MQLLFPARVGRILLLVALCAPLAAQQPRTTVQPDGISLAADGKTTSVRMISPSIIHVTVTPDGAPQHPSIAVVPGAPAKRPAQSR